MLNQTIVKMDIEKSYCSIEFPRDFIENRNFPFKQGDKIPPPSTKDGKIIFGKMGVISESIGKGGVTFEFDKVKSHYILKFPNKGYPFKTGDNLKAEIKDDWVIIEKDSYFHTVRI